MLPRPRATASRRPLATAFGGDLRSGHNFGLAFGEVSLASLGAFPLAHYDIIQTMKHALLASKSITLKAPQAKVRRIKAVIGNLR